LCKVYLGLDQPEVSEKYARQALDLAAATDDKLLKAQALDMLSESLLVEKNFSEAIAASDRSIALKQLLENKPGLSLMRSFHRLIRAYRQSGNPAKAEMAAHKGIA